MKILDMLFTVVGALLVSKVVELADNIELNCWMKRREKGRTAPIVAFHDGFMTQENADTFPMLICRDSRYGQTGATRKGPTAYSTSCLVGFIKDLGFRRIVLKCDNDSTGNHFKTR